MRHNIKRFAAEQGGTDLGEWDTRKVPQLWGHREFGIDTVKNNKYCGNGEVA